VTARILNGKAIADQIRTEVAGRVRALAERGVTSGATVIDLGVHRTEKGLVRDVYFEQALEVAGAITPAPGGVGPMTASMLLVNTVAAAESQAFGR